MADIQVDNAGLEALLKITNSLTSCDICLDKLEDPRVLPCLHTFCLTCIKSHFIAANELRLVPVSNFPCPSCRAVCYVPAKGLDTLQRDFRLDRLHDLQRVVDTARSRSNTFSAPSNTIKDSESDTIKDSESDRINDPKCDTIKDSKSDTVNDLKSDSIKDSKSDTIKIRRVSRTSSLRGSPLEAARRAVLARKQAQIAGPTLKPSSLAVDSSFKEQLDGNYPNKSFFTIHQENLSPLNRSRIVDFRGELLWTCESFSCCRDCCFLNDGQVVATDYASIGRDRVKIISATGQLLQAVESVLIIKPWAVCFNQAAVSLYITDHADTAPCITKVELSTSKHVVSSWKCSLSRPSGIAFTPGGELIVTQAGEDASLQGVATYAVKAAGSLSLVREFGTKGDDEGKVSWANYVAVDGNGRIIVSDCNSRHIKVFSAEGQQLLKFSARGSDGEDMAPQGVTVDAQGNILVAYQAVRGVHKFSPEGQQVGEVLRTLGTPWGISYDDTMKRLAVATDKGLEVYQVD